MKVKTIIPREKVDLDVNDAINYYLSEDAVQAAMGFVDALEHAYTHIARHPTSGSLRFSHELNIPGLRSWSLKAYPYLLFYVEQKHHIDVWRLLQAQRDIPAWLMNDMS